MRVVCALVTGSDKDAEEDDVRNKNYTTYMKSSVSDNMYGERCGDGSGCSGCSGCSGEVGGEWASGLMVYL